MIEGGLLCRQGVMLNLNQTRLVLRSHYNQGGLVLLTQRRMRQVVSVGDIGCGVTVLVLEREGRVVLEVVSSGLIKEEASELIHRI